MDTNLAILILVVVFTASLLEWLTRKNIFSAITSRKLLHIIAIGICALAPYIIALRCQYLLVVGAALVLLFYLIIKKLLLINNAYEHSYGIMLFALAYFILLYFFFPNEKLLIAIPMLVLSISDALAAIVGSRWGQKKMSIGNDNKSLIGSVAFFITTLLIFAAMDYYTIHIQYPNIQLLSLPLAQRLMIYGACACILTVTELFSYNGSDNFSIPIICSFLVYNCFVTTNICAATIIVAIVLASLFAVISYWQQSLSLSGAMAAFFLAVTLVSTSEIRWVLPILAFFVSGTLLTKFNTGVKASRDSKSNKPRDAMQVAANGGVAMIIGTLYITSRNDNLFLIYCCSVCASTADTWASEIGIRSRSTVYDIVTWKPVTRGLSGGITLLGLLGCTAGALYMSLICYGINGQFTATQIATIAIAGIAGCLLDSFIGSLFQAKYYNPQTNLLSDVVENKSYANLAKGFSFVTNDIVNLVTNIIITVVFFILLIWK